MSAAILSLAMQGAPMSMNMNLSIRKAMERLGVPSSAEQIASSMGVPTSDVSNRMVSMIKTGFVKVTEKTEDGRNVYDLIKT